MNEPFRTYSTCNVQPFLTNIWFSFKIWQSITVVVEWAQKGQSASSQEWTITISVASVITRYLQRFWLYLHHTISFGQGIPSVRFRTPYQMSISCRHLKLRFLVFALLVTPSSSIVRVWPSYLCHIWSFWRPTICLNHIFDFFTIAAGCLDIQLSNQFLFYWLSPQTEKLLHYALRRDS